MRSTRTRVALLFAMVFVIPDPASAEWQIKPFFGRTFSGSTTFVDLDNAIRKPNTAIGINSALLGNIVGIEADFGHVPGVFESGPQRLVLSSSATTFTGNIIVGMPRQWTEYTLRPYLGAGFGVMHVRIDDWKGVLRVRNSLPTLSLGGGVTAFFSNRVGINWDLRRFRSIGDTEARGLSFGGQRLAFWRANVAVVLRR